jgi:sporulation protein YlmC with PRC-barrel domain
MLAETMERYKVVNSVGNTIGKVKDVYIDLNNWNIIGLQISPGALKKDFLLSTDGVVKFDETDKIIIVSDEIVKVTTPDIPRKDMYPFEEMKKHHVTDNDGEKIGRIYDLEIPFEKLKMFRVWKVLIKAGFTERRLRISPSEIESVMEQIKLKKLIGDYKEEVDEE